MAKFRFYDLDVWRKAIDYANDMYTITARFPDSGRYGLISQLRRASTSIAANIAEGASRSSNKDFIRFIEIAYGSTMETVSHLCIAVKQGFVETASFENMTNSADELARMLSGLRRSLN